MLPVYGHTERVLLKFLFASALLGASFVTPAQAQAPRVQVKGELVDTWCSVTGIMLAAGTAHHLCAVWCAVGGIPVSIKDAQGNYYMVLRIAEDDENASNPRFAKIQSHEVSVDGELIERDGTKYLFVTQIRDDQGVVNLTHEDNGIQPFGN